MSKWNGATYKILRQVFVLSIIFEVCIVGLVHQLVFLFYRWIVFHCLDVPQFLKNPLAHWRTFLSFSSISKRKINELYWWPKLLPEIQSHFIFPPGMDGSCFPFSLPLGGDIIFVGILINIERIHHGLVHISLVGNDTEHLYMYLLIVCIFLFVKCLFKSLAYF